MKYLKKSKLVVITSGAKKITIANFRFVNITITLFSNMKS